MRAHLWSLIARAAAAAGKNSSSSSSTITTGVVSDLSEVAGIFGISGGFRVGRALGVDSVIPNFVWRNGNDHQVYAINSSSTICTHHQLLQKRYLSMSPSVESGRWMRISGTYAGPLGGGASYTRHPFLEGGVRFKSKKKMKKARAKKKETLHKIKRMRIVSKKSKEAMTPEERLEFRLMKGRKKMELIRQAIAKFPVQYIPPEDPDIEVLTPEQMNYLKKIGYKNKNYVPVGRRGIYGGTIQNIHLHWKKHETVQVEIAGFTKEEIKVMAVQLARLSGGVVIDIHQKKIVILYRGRNYKQPKELIPMKTLDKRKALAKSKLEQSLKALMENDKKVEDELVALRKELAENGGQYKPKLKPEPKLEDPDEYSDWSGAEDLDDDDDDDEEEDESISNLDESETSNLVPELDSESDSETDFVEAEKAVEK
ncbi:unnamed protein product [Calypogeia fissa]